MKIIHNKRCQVKYFISWPHTSIALENAPTNLNMKISSIEVAIKIKEEEEEEEEEEEVEEFV
jgi:hypothetical protein